MHSSCPSTPERFVPFSAHFVCYATRHATCHNMQVQIPRGSLVAMFGIKPGSLTERIQDVKHLLTVDAASHGRSYSDHLQCILDVPNPPASIQPLSQANEAENPPEPLEIMASDLSLEAGTSTMSRGAPAGLPLPASLPAAPAHTSCEHAQAMTTASDLANAANTNDANAQAASPAAVASTVPAAQVQIARATCDAPEALPIAHASAEAASPSGITHTATQMQMVDATSGNTDVADTSDGNAQSAADPALLPAQMQSSGMIADQPIAAGPGLAGSAEVDYTKLAAYFLADMRSVQALTRTQVSSLSSCTES